MSFFASPVVSGPASGGGIALKLHPARVARVFVGAACLLAGLHAVQLVLFWFGPDFPGRDLASRLDLNQEASLGTWFAVLTLGLCSWVASEVGRVCRRTGAPDGWRWKLAAAFLLFCSLDEMLMIHEGLGLYIEPWIETSGFFHFAWVIVAIPVVLAAAAMLFPLLWRLPRSLAAHALAAGVVYVSGAVGIEMVSARVFELGEEHRFSYALLTYVEECTEIAGTLLGLTALLRVLRLRLDGTAAAEGTDRPD